MILYTKASAKEKITKCREGVLPPVEEVGTVQPSLFARDKLPIHLTGGELGFQPENQGIPALFNFICR